jgi:hypothetical protein
MASESRGTMNLVAVGAIRSKLNEILSNPSHAVTITFRSEKLPNSKEEKLLFASSAFSWFLHVLSDRCFGKAHRKDGRHIGVITIVEGMGRNKRMHLHLAIRSPGEMTETLFLKKINSSTRKVHSFGNIVVKPWIDNGWTDYITKEKDFEVLWEYCLSSTQ